MRIGGGDRESIEGFNDIGKMTVTDLQNLIYSTYKADVQAIKNLADTAAKLQAGGLTVPGNLNISGNITGPTVNDLYANITQSKKELNTNITQTKNELNATIQSLNTTIQSLNARISNLENAKFVSHNETIKLYSSSMGYLNGWGGSGGGGVLACYGGANENGYSNFKILNIKY
jgi:hypothetical protein